MMEVSRWLGNAGYGRSMAMLNSVSLFFGNSITAATISGLTIASDGFGD
jgi:hypothetical protein